MKVWLDDVRPMSSDFDVHFVNAESLIEYIDQCVKRGEVPITHISFDHDLGADCLNGYNVASHIEKLAYFEKFPRITWEVHSANPVGKNAIILAMRSADRWWSIADKES